MSRPPHDQRTTQRKSWGIWENTQNMGTRDEVSPRGQWSNPAAGRMDGRGRKKSRRQERRLGTS